MNLEMLYLGIIGGLVLALIFTLIRLSRKTTEAIQWKAQFEAHKSEQANLSQTFHSLSSAALQRNNQVFLDLAKTTLEKYQSSAQGDLKAREDSIARMIVPISEALSKVDEKIQGLEKERVGAYSALKQQVTDLLTSQRDLRVETGNLVKALRTPHVRGRWGEIQLKRVVEMAGMIPHCDFLEQESLNGGAGRPDMIVRLPGNKGIIIDSKVPLQGYLEALEAKDETSRTLALKDHARHLRNHINSLSSKTYWDMASNWGSIEFVVMFLPGDPIFSAALEQDPGLIEFGIEKKVILATPTTLIALLHAVNYGWRQEALAANAQEISQLGKDLYKRLGDMGGHVGALGRSLTGAVDAYNKTVGSIERRILPTARKFKDLQAVSLGSDDLPELNPLDVTTRSIEAPEILSEKSLLAKGA